MEETPPFPKMSDIDLLNNFKKQVPLKLIGCLKWRVIFLKEIINKS
jgi:hypothetical protein